MTHPLKAFILAAAALAVAAPASAGGFEGGGSKSTVCHVTGPKKGSGPLRGHTITISNNAVDAHLRQHGDVVVLPSNLRFFSSVAACAVDAKGNLFDGTGKLVQSVGGETPPPPPPPPAGVTNPKSDPDSNSSPPGSNSGSDKDKEPPPPPPPPAG